MTVSEMTDILPIEDFILGHPHGFWVNVLLVLSVILFLLFLGFSGVLVWRWLRGTKKQVSAEDKALLELASLSRLPLHLEEHRVNLYSRLSECLRHYIEHHLHINFADKTEEEILLHPEWFKSLGLMAREWQGMVDYLSRGQRVKFATALVTEDEARADLEFTRHFVESTRKLPMVSKTGGAG